MSYTAYKEEVNKLKESLFGTNPKPFKSARDLAYWVASATGLDAAKLYSNLYGGFFHPFTFSSQAAATGIIAVKLGIRSKFKSYNEPVPAFVHEVIEPLFENIAKIASTRNRQEGHESLLEQNVVVKKAAEVGVSFDFELRPVAETEQAAPPAPESYKRLASELLRAFDLPANAVKSILEKPAATISSLEITNNSAETNRGNSNTHLQRVRRILTTQYKQS